MPRALAKDTPRPSQSGSLPNMPQLRHAYAPSSPSPLNFPTLSKNILSASGENNPNKEDKHENIFSAKDDDEIENIKNDSKAGQSDKSRVDSKKKVQEMQVDDVQEKRESRPSKVIV